MRVPFLESTQSGFQWVADRVWKVEHAFERANAQSQKAANTRMRIFGVLCGLAAAYVILMMFATRVSLAGSPTQMAELAGEANARAALVDRNGQLLATDVHDYNLFVDTTDMTQQDRGLVRQALMRLLPDLPRDDVAKAFSAGKRTLLSTQIKAAQRQAILDHGLPGVSFEGYRVRSYPLNETGAAYIGMTERAGSGMSGAEKALQDQITQAAMGGEPVALAMDLRVQGALENELRLMAQDQQAEDAIGLVVNVRTGELIAMASWPEFDLNRPGAYSEQAKRNHAAVDLYETGSIFKAISIGIGIDTGKATLNSVYDAREPLMVGGRRIHDDHAANSFLSLEDVFIKSSNIGTGRLAMEAGATEFTRYYEALGLFRKADTELVEPADPLYPKKWTDLSLVQTAFGQGMAVTPLSFAEAITPFLNGGYRRRLTIHKYDGTSPVQGTRVISAATSATMLDLMRSNVVKGTGTRANAPGLRVGGKTGTAQKPGKGGYTADRIASFAAVFPTDGPLEGDRYLVLILLDSPQGGPLSNGSKMGGMVAAPVAGHLINRVASFLGVQRKEDKFTSAQWDKAPVAPEVVTGEQ